MLRCIPPDLQGGKFDEKALTRNDNTKLDGPGTDRLIGLYVLGSTSLIILSGSAMGPCSVQKRWSFAWQILGLASDICVAAVIKNISDRWPSEVKEWSPSKWLTIASLLMLCAGGVMVYVAYWLTGTGYYPTKAKRVKLLEVISTDGQVEQRDVTNENQEEFPLVQQHHPLSIRFLYEMYRS